MIKTISKFKNISVIDQNQTDNIYKLHSLSYNDKSIGSGGFGSVYKVSSLNDKTTNNFVVKVFNQTESQAHAYETISILHKKIKKRQSRTRIPIFHEYPELLGLPFIAFNAYDEIDEKEIVGFLMYDLSNFGYEDYGSDDTSSLLEDVDIEDKLFYSYQLSKIISFLHENKFIHADISENAIWINKSTKKLAIIDYDSGFHYDKQKKPTTIGKITQWIGGGIRNIIGNKIDSNKITIKERLDEENWILANANFELLTGLQPYFFLVDADDKSKKKYLEKYIWPNVENSCELFNTNNQDYHDFMLNFLSELDKYGLSKLTSAFNITFNEGYTRETKRLSTLEWKNLLFNICNQLESFKPSIKSFEANKKQISRKDETVVFNWNTVLSNSVYLNNELMPLFSEKQSLDFSKENSVQLKVINDFGEQNDELAISTKNIIPKIEYFKGSRNIRNSIEPVVLEWSVKDADKVIISSFAHTYIDENNIKVKPKKKTTYTLTAYGNFENKISQQLTIDVEEVLPKIISFKTNKNVRDSKEPLILSWEVKDAIHVEIEDINNDSIKQYQPKGEIKIYPTMLSKYKLTAYGHFDNKISEILIADIEKPVINSFTWEVNLEHGLDNIDLKWETSSTKTVNIYPKIGKSKLNGIEHIGISEPTEFTIEAKGIFASVTKKIKAFPFPVPVVESILVKTPTIELNYNFDSSNLSIPSNLTKLTKINFENHINFDSNIDYEILNKIELKKENIIIPQFINNNDLINKYKEETISFNTIFNKIKEIIFKKLNSYETKTNN